MIRILFPAFLLLFLGCSAPERESPTQGNLTLLASESLTPLMSQEAFEFQRIYPGVNITVLPTLTREAIVALFTDTIRAAATDRPLNEEELSVMKNANLPIMETKIGEDALVVLVNKKNGLSQLSVKDLGRILSGDIKHWEQVSQSGRKGNIQLSLTKRNSGVYELLEKHFFRLERGINIHAPTTSARAVMEEVKRNPATLGIVSFSFFKSTGATATSTLRSLQIAEQPDSGRGPVSPSQQTISSKEYPLSYPLYLYVKEEKAGPGSGFASFLTSQPGQKIIQNAGILPVNIPSRPVQIVQEH